MSGHARFFVYETKKEYTSPLLSCATGMEGSEVLLHRWLLQSKCRTSDPEAADFFYVPFYSFCFQSLKRNQFVFFAADPGFRHAIPLCWHLNNGKLPVDNILFSKLPVDNILFCSSFVVLVVLWFCFKFQVFHRSFILHISCDVRNFHIEPGKEMEELDRHSVALAQNLEHFDIYRRRRHGVTDTKKKRNLVGEPYIVNFSNRLRHRSKHIVSYCHTC